MFLRILKTLILAFKRTCVIHNRLTHVLFATYQETNRIRGCSDPVISRIRGCSEPVISRIRSGSNPVISRIRGGSDPTIYRILGECNQNLWITEWFNNSALGLPRDLPMIFKRPWKVHFTDHEKIILQTMKSSFYRPWQVYFTDRDKFIFTDNNKFILQTMISSFYRPWSVHFEKKKYS